MREIKFRAWLQNDEDFMPSMEDDVSSWNDPFGEYEKGNIILMQYTGLKDKNGREIYEGDILKGVDFRLRAEYVSQVKWHEKGYWYAFNKDGKGIGFVNNIELLEVIGNIYENPELLEGDSN